MEQKIDNVNHPPHYTWLKDKCGIEVPVVEGSEYCREHKEYMEERQCQR